MRLESIGLHGFKSFGEKTVVKVLPGITGIVGPNGCGKSNVGECIRWALGEQSAKSLRGHRMEDLIFHGSASRKPVGLAEVELVFSNDGDLAIAFSEIAVGRRLYRTGDSEYVLNGAVCRLRDILDLFAGTGANPRAYSVMDQDKLNHVLTAKPQERRLFIEEAAGIARYKQQRSETQGKLEATRQNLARVRDVMEEVRRQLASLERQARRARQYKALQQDKRELALTVAAADFATLTTAAAETDVELGRLRAEGDTLRARGAALAGREALQRQSIQTSDHRLSDLRQSVQKVQAELERLLERREQMGIQLREATEEATRLDGEIRAAGERLDAIVGERDAVARALEQAEALAVERAEATRVLEGQVAEQHSALTGDRDRLEALRLEQVRLAGERTDLERSAGELRERRAQLERRAERLAAELTETEAEASQLATRRRAIESSRERALAQLAALETERSALEVTLEAREGDRADATGRLAELRVTLAARRSSLEALRELERAREGYGSGVRAVFAEGQPAGLRGLVGTVADLLDVPRGLERAVEAVLGERLEWVVVERYEDAKAAVAFLDLHRAGVATFLPLEFLEPHANGGGPSHRVNGRAADGAGTSTGDGANGGTHRDLSGVVTQSSAPTRALTRYLLGDVTLADDLDQAEALWRANTGPAMFVTPAGQVLGAGGRLHGGAPATSPEQSLLGRKREIRELEDDVERVERALATAQATVAALETEVATLRTKLPLLTQALAATEASRVGSEKDLEQWGREHERVDRHRQTLGVERSQVDAELAETLDVLERLERRIVVAGEAEASQETVMAGLREAIDGAQDREAELGRELTARRVESASATERVEALGRERVRIDEMERHFGEALAQGRERRSQALERATWLAEERERTDLAAREVALERDRLEDESRVAAGYHERLTAEFTAIESETRGLEGALRAVTATIHELELRATESRVRREELALEARRSYGVEEADLLARHDPDADLNAVRARVIELGEKLESFGGVNLVADEEYRELDERLTFLRTQHDDLNASVKDLDTALRGMTRSAQERFAHAFEEVNGHFVRLFERLFEGGRAELRLVPPEEGDDPLDTGVELMAQPRGKRLQAVTLLSGGERALTGLALLFAIFYYRPSPFCVLDEVDAPLDDANIVRFLRVLRELTSQTQFLVITHNRKTMEAADVLYGVTMEEPGLSKLVAVNLGA
jgi:chromosome segregation protein